MVQMTAADQAIVKALPGNSQCCDCGMKNPQWASVSFGNVFCLECSGVHRYVEREMFCVIVVVDHTCARSMFVLAFYKWVATERTARPPPNVPGFFQGNNLYTWGIVGRWSKTRLTLRYICHKKCSSLGVHISFVRSIAMDSWTDAQLALMKTGGNAACNDYLQKQGIGPRTPIKQKYESDVAQLYKLVLKARVEGKPEPTVLPPKPAPKTPVVMAPAQPAGSTDVNGMERLVGETDQQYVARQTRLREEAKARMQAKFGNSGMSGGGRMQGIGSDSSYNPNGSGSGIDVDSLVTGFGTALSSMRQSVSGIIQEDQVQSLKKSGASFWGQFANTVSNVASSVTGPDDSDGLAGLQRQVAAQKPTNSVYAGFGSDTYNNNNSGTRASPHRPPPPSSSSSFTSGSGSAFLQEAQGLPGEDRNGIERLTGESDEQYVMRQTRLREEARARMAAKFGNSATMTGVGSNSMSAGMGSMSTPSHTVPQSAPSSGNMNFAMPPPHSSNIRSAPSSGNAPTNFPRPKSPPKSQVNSNDFFSTFGA